MCALRRWGGHRAVWIGVGLVVALLIAVALLRYVGTLLFALFLYYATRPLYRRIDRHVDHPDLTATLTIALVVLPMIAVVGYAGLVALRELDSVLAASDLGPYREALEPYLSLARDGDLVQIREALRSERDGSLASTLQRGLPGILGRLSSTLGFVFAVLARLLLLATFLFYLLRDDLKLRRWFADSVDHDEELLAFLDGVDDDLQTVFVGNLAVVGVAAVAAAVVYFGLNLVASGGRVVGTPVLLAALIGIGTLVPVVGMKLVYVPYGLYLLVNAVAAGTPLWQPVAFLVLSLVVVDTVPDFFARSLLSARSGVHMGLVLIGYILGSFAFGWYGLFLGPIVVVVAVHFAHEVFPRLASTALSS